MKKSTLPDWQLITLEGNRAVIELTATSNHPLFTGHFPDYPLLPGVAQIHWATELANEVMSVDTTPFNAIKSLKFNRPILPGTALTIELEWRERAEERHLLFSYHSTDGRHSSGTVVFSVGEPAR